MIKKYPTKQGREKVTLCQHEHAPLYYYAGRVYVVRSSDVKQSYLRSRSGSHHAENLAHLAQYVAHAICNICCSGLVNNNSQRAYKAAKKLDMK